MVKVVNISSKTIEIAGTTIKPHTTKMFSDMSTKDRLRLSAMNAVGIVRAYDGDYSNKPKIENIADKELEVIDNTPKDTKPAKKSNRKK